MKQLFSFRLHTLLLALAVFTLFACKKNDAPAPDGPELPDLVSRVSSTVSGFVTDETNAAVQGALVTVGASTSTTDEYGFFEFRDVQVVKNAAVVAVTMPGYFKGVRTYIAEQGKTAAVRIKLIPKTILGNIDAASGGSASAPNGLKIELPANGVVVESSGSAYTGPVTVSAHWLNPTATDLSEIMPGDLRALNASGEMKKLITYGMAAVELTGSGGQKLQVAPGKKSNLTVPLPSSLQGSAPANIPLWHFDETKGLWIEEGSAVKSGDKYVGEVSHFSFWNYDVPTNFVQLNCTILDHNGVPLPWAAVRISEVSDPNNVAYGYTNAAGYVSGAVPDNAQLLVQVFGAFNCGLPIHTQTVSTTNVDISLGNITLPATNMASVSGTVTDCSMAPVTNGHVIMNYGGINYRYNVDNTGAFSFSTALCGSNNTVTIVAEDLTGMQQSTPISHALVSGSNAMGNLQACGVTTSQFINFTVNGTSFGFTSPSDSLYMSGNGTNNMLIVGSFQISGNRFANIGIDNTNIGVGSVQNLVYFESSDLNDSVWITTPIPVNITEYGNVGEFISGNFSGTLTGAPPAGLTYNITSTFRVRRSF